MKKLNNGEILMLMNLREGGPLTPGEDGTLLPVLDSLVKKKRTRVEMTDDGPRYIITTQGLLDIGWAP
jgi:hypothetical protein